MSMSTIRGEINNFSPKPEENYYGLEIKKTNGDTTWINGTGSVPENFDKGDVIKAQVNKDEFIDIKDIMVVEKNNEQGGSVSSSNSAQNQSSSGGVSTTTNSTSSNSLSKKDRRILVQVAMKEAAETVRKQNEDGDPINSGQHLESVSELTNGYFNLLKKHCLEKTAGDNQ